MARDGVRYFISNLAKLEIATRKIYGSIPVRTLHIPSSQKGVVSSPVKPITFAFAFLEEVQRHLRYIACSLMPQVHSRRASEQKQPGLSTAPSTEIRRTTTLNKCIRAVYLPRALSAVHFVRLRIPCLFNPRRAPPHKIIKKMPGRLFVRTRAYSLSVFLGCRLSSSGGCASLTDVTREQ